MDADKDKKVTIDSTVTFLLIEYRILDIRNAIHLYQ